MGHVICDVLLHVRLCHQTGDFRRRRLLQLERDAAHLLEVTLHVNDGVVVEQVEAQRQLAERLLEIVG